MRAVETLKNRDSSGPSGTSFFDLPSRILLNGLLPLLSPDDLLAFELTCKFFKRLIDKNRHLCQKSALIYKRFKGKSRTEESIEIKSKTFHVIINKDTNYVYSKKHFELQFSSDEDIEVCHSASLSHWQYREKELEIDVVTQHRQYSPYSATIVEAGKPPLHLPEDLVLEHVLNKVAFS